MKKILLTIFFVLIFFIKFNVCYSSSYVTYYYGEAIKVEKSDVEILSNEITIDLTTSKINNVVFLKNTTNEEINTSIILPLENQNFSTTINNLSIVLNGFKVDYTQNDNGEYIIKTKIPAGSGKKLEITYNTDNDLQNAKVIKYNLENFANRIVGKVKVNVVIDEKNIPLIQKIYPGHYTFENNTISVEYYNYKVNTITKEVIIQKETFNNLLYGREIDINDQERTLIQNWNDGGKNIDTSKLNLWEMSGICLNIINYINIKNNEKHEIYEEILNPFLYDMYIKNVKTTDDYNLKGKIVCIDFVETEDDKELYMKRIVDSETVEDEDGYPHVRDIEDYFLTPERKILKTDTDCNFRFGAKIIYVGEGINGEDLNATEEEIIEYVNSINADMYIRIEIYDGKITYKDIGDNYGVRRIGNGKVGYYNKNNFEIAKAFALSKYDTIESEELYNKIYNVYYKSFYSDYSEYSKNYYNDYYKDTLIYLSNEYIANNSEIPTVVQFIANRISENGKYIVEYLSEGFYNDYGRGLATTSNALKTSQAQKLLKQNKSKNANIKTDIESRISNLEILNNEENIQKQIQLEIEENNQKNNPIMQTKNNYLNLNNTEIAVFAGIGIASLICIIILIKENKKRKKGEMYNGKQ